MKYLLSWILNTFVFLGVYFLVFDLAVIASWLTEGVSTYIILVALAGVSGLMGPIMLAKDKTQK